MGLLVIIIVVLGLLYAYGEALDSYNASNSVRRQVDWPPGVKLVRRQQHLRVTRMKRPYRR